MSAAPDSAQLKAALAYAARFKWGVFPCFGVESDGRCQCHDPKCDSEGKHPLVPGGFKAASSDPTTIRDWWTRWPDANVAAATGERSGFDVVDVDPPLGPETVSDLEREHGELPETVEAITGRLGRHVLFIHASGLQSRNGVLSGVDVKADGGYVVAPPSRHKSGRSYHWEGAHRPGEVELAPWPAWLLGLVSAKAERGTNGRVDVAAVLAGVPEGQRDTALYRFVCKLRSADVPEAAAAELALKAARAARPPFPETRALEKVRRAYASFAPSGGSQAHLTDSGNADQLVRLHGERLRFDHSAGRWLIWTGSYWSQDETGGVLRLARHTTTAMLATAAGRENEDERKRLATHALKTESEARLRAMTKLATADASVAIVADALDSDPWLLNVQNGTIDLRNGELREHRAEDLISYSLPVSYDPEARAPLWERFLDRVLNGDAELIDFVNKAAGYSATGVTREQAFFLLYGRGANGKSTLLETLHTLFGDLAISAEFRTFLVRRGDSIPNDLARLRGKRFVSASEGDEGRRLAESTIKAMTGGDRITARFLHREYFDFTPTHKIWLSANHKPVIRGTDEAIWRRVRLIPFSVTIPPSERDPDLATKLKAELPGILAWVIRGCRCWLQSGLGEATAVTEATLAYRHEMDTLADFLDEQCVLEPGAIEFSSKIYKAYKLWAEATGEEALSSRKLSTRLRERAANLRLAKHRGLKAWFGLRLKSPAERTGDREST